MFGAIVAAAVLSICVSVSVARADVIYKAMESPTFRGHFDQNATDNGMPPPNGTYLITPNSGIPGAQKGPQACAPTSVANSFVYLQDQYGITGLGGANNAAISYDTINTLASRDYMNTQDQVPNGAGGYTGGGTSFQNAALGKEQYLKDNADNIKDKNGNPVVIQTVGQLYDDRTLGPGNYETFTQDSDGEYAGGITATKPTPDFLEQQLAAGEDVEMFFRWTDSNGNPVGGGHVVNLYKIDFDLTTNAGSLSFVDPINSDNGNYTNGTGDAPELDSTSLKEAADGYLVFGYQGGATGIAAEDNPDGAAYGELVGALAESPLPEPTSLVLAAIGGMLLISRRRKSM